MGLLTEILLLPLAPVRATIKLGEVIQEQVDRELHDPAVIRRRLEEIERARVAGEISEEEEAQAQAEVLAQMAGRDG
jgi:cytochrome c-type biogenesis protein CcmH/NrfG